MVGRPPSFPADEVTARVTTAATRQFSTEGYEAATVDAIAAEAGVSKPVLYRAFGSKSELYATLLKRCAEELASAAMRSFEAGSAGANEKAEPVQQFRQIIDSWFTALGERPDEWRLLNNACSNDADSNDPSIKSTIAEIVAMQLRNDVTMIRTFLPNLPEAEVEPIAEAIRGSLSAIGNWWLNHPDVDRDVPVAAMTKLCAGLSLVAN